MQGRDPDLEIWRQAQRHDAAAEVAYAQLRRKYTPLVYTELRKRNYYTGEEDLHDLAQRVWIAVWNSLPTFRGQSAFSTWLVGITKNIAFDWLRRKKVEERAVYSVVQERLTSDEALTESQIVTHAAVHQAVMNLVQTEREVIYLRYFAQLTDEAIAKQLETPLGTVKSRIRAGLVKLKAAMQDEAGR
ncbi:MAG TPA: sigma-70 family RNA polymerase sigma factor [Chthonomonadaceae bacterium]|nr:sigma-70 family RNA polymerase sigma factor [Chthonomonadaceae bacterium]